MYQSLLNWYRKTARVLPWRSTDGPQEPYRVWVSEVMLQQTRAEAVIPYYLRFMEALPTVEALAAASIDTLYKLWEGLGYYSRVRNLQKTAQLLVAQYDGRLPADYDLLKKLPGIGDYTAGAIASIAYNLPVPAVDGNVLRVWARLTGDSRDILDAHTRADIRRKVQAALPPDAPGDFNQALMDLGATLCVPHTAPICEACPWQSFCVGHRDGTASLLPIRAPKPMRRVEHWTLFILHTASQVALLRRPAKGVLAGQWSLPGFPGTLSAEETRDYLTSLGFTVRSLLPLPSAKHIFTHLEWHMTAWQADVDAPTEGEGFRWFSPQEVENLALPSAYRAYRSLL